LSEFDYLKVNFTAEYAMQVAGLTKEEAQLCIKWIQEYQAQELVETANKMIRHYAKGVQSGLLN
jgi:hypothetical protein